MNEVKNRNNVEIRGQGERVIIFAHGFGCDQSMWRFIAPAFEEDYRIILFDYVGSGNSNIGAYCSNKYSTLQGYVQDVLDIIEELNLQNVIFIGHSVSSMIGMLASIQQPQYFDKLIMIGPSPCYLNMENGYVGGFEKSDILELLDMMEMNFKGWASYMAPLVTDHSEHPKLTQELEHSFVSTNPSIARQFAEVTFFSDHRSNLSQATVPALIIQCSNDSIVPIEVGEYLHKYLKNSELFIMEAKGHYPHISHPKETVSMITQYLMELPK